MKIVVTTLLPAIDHPNADRWNAVRSRQYTLTHCTQCTLRGQKCTHCITACTTQSPENVAHFTTYTEWRLHSAENEAADRGSSQ